MRPSARRPAALFVALALAVPSLFLAATGHVLLGALPAAMAALVVAWGMLPGRRGSLALALAGSAGALFFGVRCARVEAPPGWSVCEGSECSRRGPWWSRLAPERATLDVGLLASRLTSRVTADEAASYSRAFAAPLDELEPTPNPLVLVSTTSTLRRVVVEPPGNERARCVVFLHGFGGLSSAYVRVIERALPDTVIVAPALDIAARWDSEQGRNVLERTLASLPERADRSRVVLLALSNGAIFGARYAPSFAGAVLVSGVGDSRAPLHVVTGDQDVRIAPAWVRDRVAELRAKGVKVELDVVPGADHALFLTQPEAWARRVRTVE